MIVIYSILVANFSFNFILWYRFSLTLIYSGLNSSVDAHQRFFRALCIALKVPRAIEICKQAVAAGKCVVIGLQTTGQSGTDSMQRADARKSLTSELADLKDNNEDSDDDDSPDQEFASAPSATLQKVIYKLFPYANFWKYFFFYK